MTNGFIIRGSLCLLSLFTTIGSAKAAVVPLNGTFGFTPLGDVSYSGADLEDAVSITLPSMELINTVPAIYNGNPNDFFSGPASISLGAQVAIAPLTLNMPVISGSFSSVSFINFLDIPGSGTPGDHFDFDLLELEKTSSGPSSLNLYGTGILHDSQGHFADTPGIISIAFTQTGQIGAVNASFSVATSSVPEPGTITTGAFAIAFLLIGSVCWSRRSAH